MSTLEIHTNPNAPDDLQAYAAGLLEGNVSAHRIYEFYVNVYRNLSYKSDGSSETYANGNGTRIPPNAHEYLKENEKWVWNMIEKSPDCPYWHLVKLSKIQIFGLYAGQRDAENGRNLSLHQIFLINYQQNIGDIVKYKTKSEKINKKFLESDHCSAFIKVTANNTDLLMAHTSFSLFNTMTRIWKLYDFHYHVNDRSRKPLPVHAVSFSSYPATITSIDDFYQTSKGLVITETTNAVLEPKLYEMYLKPESLIEVYRVLVANRLSWDSEMWVKIFSALNDGTYCNQWMVVDYKKFTPGKPVPDKTFYVAEQIPGDVIYAD